MPELPEVETVRRGLEPVLEGSRLIRVQARRPDLRFPLPKDFQTRLEGRRVSGIGRRAKYLLVALDGPDTLMIHLGMSGRIRIHRGPPPPPEPHDHVDFATAAEATIRFHDPRRFGFMDLIPTETLFDHPLLASLGPEPLDNAFDGPGLAARLRGKKTSIKAALMDQRVVAGLGNIYVSESLFRAGISPKRTAATVQGGRAEKLAQAIRAVLNDAIAAGGSSLRDHRQPSGGLGYFQHRFAVYGRDGEACPGCTCAEKAIRSIVQGGRATYFCPTRQR